MCRESGDYQTCENRRRAEYIGVRHDLATIRNNNALEVRIQHAFMKVRGGIMRYNLRYDWFKIRTANGIDKFKTSFSLRIRCSRLPLSSGSDFPKQEKRRLPSASSPQCN